MVQIDSSDVVHVITHVLRLLRQPPGRNEHLRAKLVVRNGAVDPALSNFSLSAGLTASLGRAIEPVKQRAQKHIVDERFEC